jgi:hypothetical protein
VCKPPQFLTPPSSKTREWDHGRMPPRSGRESCILIKPILPVDGYACQPARGVLHRYMGCRISTASNDPEGCYTATARARSVGHNPECFLILGGSKLRRHAGLVPIFWPSRRLGHMVQNPLRYRAVKGAECHKCQRNDRLVTVLFGLLPAQSLDLLSDDSFGGLK